MGLAATRSTRMAQDVARATAQELSAVGVNWILGPVLDVLTNARNQPLGVRAAGDDPQEVSKYGVAIMKGYQEAGIATCGKHFPSYGKLEFLGEPTDVPTITDSLEQLSQSALIPFRNAISEGLDAMMVGGVAMSSANMNVMHACLSEQIVQELLRASLHFNGVVVSECLEMEALSHNIGVGGGTVMAVKAGCDVVLLCRNFSVQQEAMNGLRLGVENGIIGQSLIRQSLERVLRMKARRTSWEKALNPAGIDYLSQLQPTHTDLSTSAYNTSITVVRDQKKLLPLSKILQPDEELLLLTPLLKPLPASAAFFQLEREASIPTPEHASAWEASASMMSGERVFRELGRSLARQRNGRVLHTSYTANGLRPQHETLISRAEAVVVVTADAGRNLYQNGFTKHVSMTCKANLSTDGHSREKPFIVVAVSSPYDFATDLSIGTYICSYDFTETALRALVKVLYGELNPTGGLPSTIHQSQKLPQSRQHWLVENWNEERDSNHLDALLASLLLGEDKSSILTGTNSNTFLLRSPDVEESHFVVRNSTTRELYGFSSTYYFKCTGIGVIGSILVDPSHRRLSIGHSLHNRAIRSLLQRKGITRFQIGSRLPSIYLGIPSANSVDRKNLRQWFANMGWHTTHSMSSLHTNYTRPVCSMILRNLPTWQPQEGLRDTLSNPNIKYDLVNGSEYEGSVFEHIKRHTRQEVEEIYTMALADKVNCGIIRAKTSGDSTILGSVVIFKSDSKIATYVPSLASERAKGVLAGGISSPVIHFNSTSDNLRLLQGLILLGIRQFRKQGAGAVILDCVSPRWRSPSYAD